MYLLRFDVFFFIGEFKRTEKYFSIFEYNLGRRAVKKKKKFNAQYLVSVFIQTEHRGYQTQIAPSQT